jgi:hypothetical protein
MICSFSVGDSGSEWVRRIFEDSKAKIITSKLVSSFHLL